MRKRVERSRETYDNMAAEYDTSPEGNYTMPHKAELIKRVLLRDGDSILDVACGNGTLYLAEPFFPPVVRWLANTLWFPFSKSGDVKVYSAKELTAIFQAAGFCEVETDANGTVLFFSVRK